MNASQHISIQNSGDGRPAPNGTITAFMAWLWAWLTAANSVDYAPQPPAAPSYYVIMNRRDHRREARGVPVSHDLRHFYHLLPKELSKNQFFERLARISILGRTNVYQLWRRCLVTHYHRVPDGQAFSVFALMAGVWDAHILPGWTADSLHPVFKRRPQSQAGRQNPLRASQAVYRSHVTSSLNPAN